MIRDFSESEVKSLCELVGVKDLRDTEEVLPPRPVLIEDVRRILKLPVLPHSHLLDDETWMLGGRVVRWLGGEMTGAEDDGDYDIFPGSLQAFERTLQRMLDEGYKVSLPEWKPRLPWLLVPRKMRGKPPQPRFIPPSAAAPHLPGMLVRRMPDGREMHCLRLVSPQRHVIQFMHIPHMFPNGPRPDVLIAQTDLSICQLTLDGRYMHAGPYSWGDFLRRRLRSVYIRSGRRTAGRLLKYSMRGFLPYPRTAGTVSATWLAEALKRGGDPTRGQA
jgi:hypothetical protein